MAVNQYRKFKISVDEDSKRTQGLQTGDIVRRQYKDGSDIVYTLMCVLDTGVDSFSVVENGVRVQKKKSWFVGALLEGDAPSSNEVLDFVRVTNLWDANRLGAIYLTADDANSPYMDVIDGIPVEKSLCYPASINNTDIVDDFSQYHVVGKKYVTSGYQESLGDNNRIVSITKNNVPVSDSEFVGISQTIDSQLGNPDRVLVSYKVRASGEIRNAVATLGYEDGSRIDGTVGVNIGTEWEYKLHVITIENSDRHRRSFKLNINDKLQEGDKVEIADMNIILLASISNFAGGMKVRVGRLDGVVDPVFGHLQDYGAYMQRLYATKQVNIAGTLTAGDENGFGSTFYAGKIHKNTIINSIACDFSTGTEAFIDPDNPVGIGEVYKVDKETSIIAQTSKWIAEKKGQEYCFSFWMKSDVEHDVLVSQNDFTVRSVRISGGNQWERYSVVFKIKEPYTDLEPLKLSFLPAEGILYMTAPQLEKGNRSTQYQPTDDVLAYVDDYGAWFSKGGIGGTIQNPLLKLNEDGSISSKNNSFVIRNDGSGYMAGGRFEWNSDQITLRGIKIKWEDFDEDAQDRLKPKSIKIIGQTAFMYDRYECSPKSITLQLEEVNFNSTEEQRQWYYAEPTGVFVPFEAQKGKNLTIFPNGAYWKDDSTAVIKCIVTLNSVALVDTITIQRVRHGEDAYSVLITTSNGNTFKNGVGTTTLTAHVYKGGTEITEKLHPKDFDWIKTSANDIADEIFNESHIGFGNSLVLSADDVFQRAQFDCRVRIN